MEVSHNLVRTGALVRVRRQRWRVSEVLPYQDCELLTLLGADLSNLGVHRQVIAPFDLVEPVQSPCGIRRVGSRHWHRLCGSLIADHCDASGLRTARQARITLLPYQLEPALAVVGGLGSRVLIADEVGLGKTVQAALILSELKARGAAERILIFTPAGLRDQWSGELAERFSLHVPIVDMRDLRRRAAALPLGTNPWSTVPAAIVSVDFAKRPEILSAIRSTPWDVVVVDEAHGIAPGSDRHQAVSTIASLAPYVVLLTATPHSGDRSAFDSLCRLGDTKTDALLVFRRSRHQAGVGGTRRKHQLMIRPSAEERHMHELLAHFIRTLCNERGHADRDLSLALTTLHKRALSSAWSLERSVTRRLDVLARRERDDPHQPGLPFDDREGELDGADDVPAWISLGLNDVEQERTLLNSLGAAARGAAARETKLRALGRLMRRLHALREQAIVFTEYRDTLLRVRQRLPYACAILHGGMTRDERQAALADFSSGRTRILLATDAAGEGLNLHQACRVIVNLELPWNPVRLEQRAGRVDRIGQPRTVHAFHLIARDTAETRILERLSMRIASAHEDIDGADPLGLRRDSVEVTLSDLPATRLPPDTWPPNHSQSERQIYERPLLQSKALTEHVRLAYARALLGQENHRAPFVAGGPSMLTFTRRPMVRSRLGSQVLVVVRSVVEDSCGRVIASRLTGALVCPTNRLLRSTGREDLARLWPVLEKAAVDLANQTTMSWHQEVADIHGLFWRTRIRRETAIAAAIQEARGAYQLGLFEKRAVARHLAWTDERRDLLDDLACRRSGAQRLAAAGRSTAAIALVLAP